MTGQAVTFDFHNTLASCPEWFELEVRRLPSAFLGWRAAARAVQFDPDLASAADVKYRELRRDIIEHGIELTAEACLQSVFEALPIDILALDIDEGVEHLMRKALNEARPVPGAIETVRAIHHAGIPVGVISSAVYHPFLEWTLSAFGIRDRFAAVVTSASAGYYKSRPELLLARGGFVARGAAPGRACWRLAAIRRRRCESGRHGDRLAPGQWSLAQRTRRSHRISPCSHWKPPRRGSWPCSNRVSTARRPARVRD